MFPWRSLLAWTPFVPCFFTCTSLYIYCYVPYCIRGGEIRISFKTPLVSTCCTRTFSFLYRIFFCTYTFCIVYIYFSSTMLLCCSATDDITEHVIIRVDLRHSCFLYYWGFLYRFSFHPDHQQYCWLLLCVVCSDHHTGALIIVPVGWYSLVPPSLFSCSGFLSHT